MHVTKLDRSAIAVACARALLGVVLFVSLSPAAARGNAITDENLKPGSPASEWQVAGSGDPTIQGFATDISTNVTATTGATVDFKVSTTAATFRIDIYRLGWYGGDGAHKVTTLGPFAGAVQAVPAADPVTGLVDCGGWSVSASWSAPAGSVSGIYLARLVREDDGGASHIAFVLRDDESTSDLVFKTSDATWQAYNVFGGNSLYVGSVSGYPGGHATKVSYNRPFVTRAGGGGGGAGEDWLFNAEYPMVRWLESNGYDVTYTTDVDTDRNGALLLNHDVFLSVGHDEYWSAGARAAVEAARDAGHHLAFFSGNESYWKTRWESSAFGSVPYRTLVCYKEGTLGENVCGGKCDPVAGEWTGLWRDGCDFPLADGCRPENSLSGQISWNGTSGDLQVPDTFKNLRFWRNTSVAALGAGQTATLTPGTLGFEWDPEQTAFAGSYPPGRVRMSSTSVGGGTHHLSLYRSASGAFVFGAGTCQWSWGLDDSHDRGGDPPSLAMQQATVNLLADMGVQPGGLRTGTGLVAATASADATPPASTIDAPVAGATIASGVAVTISGTATEAAGVVAGVEVSVDGGATWRAASGTTAWTISWTPATTGAVTIKARAFDDLGNLESPGSSGPNVVAVTVGNGYPPPTDGPGGPILVVSAAANPFSRYYVEILRAEGFNLFDAMDLSTVTPAVLAAHDVVILGEMPLDAGQVTMLTDWTNAGGTLVAMRPDPQLDGLLGTQRPGGGLANGYLLVNTASGPGVGIVGQTIQYHGTADYYTLNGATSLATLYADAATATAYPAVTSRDVGSNGGKAVAFAYDLARSVVLTRQGNPAWQNQKRDGAIPPIRSDDLFYGNASFDPQPDWVNLARVAIPQADEQQRLLANVMTLGNLHRMPLPRFWYLPKGLKAAVVMTGDNHGDGGMQPRFDVYVSQSPANCSVDDWECVRATGYEFVGSTFTNAQAVFYRGLGFEVAQHINTGCASVPAAQYEADAISQRSDFAAAFPGIPLPRTNRTHCIAWTDYTSVPELEARNGIRFDTNYYYWPYAWFAGVSGHFTGSGLPMRFAKQDGTLIDCYQANTQLTDDSYSDFTAPTTELIDRALGPEGYYAVLTANLHFDNTNHPGSNEIVAVAQARGVPVVSAEQMLDWLDGRNNSSFANLVWSGNTLSFSIAAASGSRNLRAMLPMASSIGPFTGITLGGTPVAYTTETIKGVAYAFFPASAGNYVATYNVDLTPPLISAVVATPNEDGTATITWSTTEPSDSRVDYGTSADPLTLNATAAALVSSHTLTLSGLTPSTTYHFRVTSADAAANSATEPSPPAAPLTFTTPAPVCFKDDTQAQFAAGTPDAGIVVTSTGNGELALTPAAGSDFAVLPPTGEWQAFPFAAGGAATVSGGVLQVDGARFNTEPEGTVWNPGSSVEFVATFSPVAHQYAGFGGGTDEVGGGGIYNVAPWAMFGTGATGSQMLARVNLTGASSDFPLGAGLLGSPHRYRVDWKGASVDFWVDGALVHTEPASPATSMRVAISDLSVGGPALAVDWVRVSPPYAASGTFLSRVYDGLTATTWGEITWSATVPTGTSVQLAVRRGDTATPDGSWTAFTPTPVSGAVVGGSSRYLQYRAELATSDPAVTPELATVHIACASGPDLTPPAISAVSATPGAGGVSATVTWTTDEPADSRVDYGTSPGSLGSNASDGALVASHSLALSGLTPATTYHYRVTSTDGSGNSASSPVPPATLTFTTPAAPCPADQTLADFGLGTPDANTLISLDGDGEVVLRPSGLAEDFQGSTLPAAWTAAAYGSGGGATVASGALTVDGWAAASGANFGPGRSLEFVATFSLAGFQNIGFAADAAFGSPWVVIGEGGSPDGTLYARTWGGASVALGAGLLGAPHRYRIDWDAASFSFRVDGVLVTTLPATVATNSVVVISDFASGGGTLQVDWLRVTPYAASGTFLSRVFDGGGPVQWGALTWSADTPAGTAIAMSVRTGDTPTPDGSWTPYDPVPNGSLVGANSRYVQYRADLSSAAPSYATPVLRDVAIACTVGPDLAPPVISDVVATPAPDGVSATVAWNTDERATSRVDYGVSPDALVLSASDATRVRPHSLVLPGLSAGVTYWYRVRSSDAAANEATEPNPPAPPLSFTTPLQPCMSDVTDTDFGAGTHAGTVVTLEADGEVALAAALGTEFPGTALPAEWTSVAWTGGTSTVSGGQVSVTGARLTPVSTAGWTPTASVPVVIEFVATFGAEAYQNAGLGAGDNTLGTTGMFADGTQAWAMFGTANSTNNLFMRVNTGAASDVALASAASYLGSAHRYRIEWRPDSVIFTVDGASMGRFAAVLTAAMRPGISDYALASPVLQVDWLRLTPYGASGTFTSRVYDSGTSSSWGAMTWSADVPAGTSLAMSARKGDTPSPDGTWSAWAPIAASGNPVGGVARYVQYAAALSANPGLDRSPLLRDVGITCGACNAGAPAVIADLAGIATANPGSGRSRVRLTWSGVTAGDAVAVYRKGFGDYPLYRTDHGAVPAAPANPAAAAAEGWTLTGVTASGTDDSPPVRDAWHYVAFVTNACSVVSGPSNVTGGTLDYLLGDVSSGAAVCSGAGEAGDGTVSIADFTALGSEYGQTFGTADSRVCLDVGPTADYGLRSRPTPDGRLDFEDLVLYALNFEVPLPAIAARAQPEHAAWQADELSLEAPANVRAGEFFEVQLRMRGTGGVHAVSARFAWDATVAKPEGVAAGNLLTVAGGGLLSPRPGVVDAAVLGRAAPGLSGEGTLAIVRFRAVRDGDPGVRLAGSLARDAQNHPVTLGSDSPRPAALPRATTLGAVFPNPFRGSLSVSFTLARESRARLAVFDLAGRVVRHLEDGARPAGFHVVTWDGRGDTGAAVPAGFYLVRFEAGEVVQTRRVQVVR